MILPVVYAERNIAERCRTKKQDGTNTEQYH